MKNKVFFGMGCNVGDCLENLKNGIANLKNNDIIINKISSVYITSPVGYLDQPAFHNIVVEAETDLSPSELLKCVKKIEQDMGREKTVRFGPRNIDIDILVYNDIVYKSDNLIIPHERMHERAFVLVPFSEIAGDYIHPVLNKSIKDLCSEVDCSGVQLTDKVIG